MNGRGRCVARGPTPNHHCMWLPLTRHQLCARPHTSPAGASGNSQSRTLNWCLASKPQVPSTSGPFPSRSGSRRTPHPNPGQPGFSCWLVNHHSLSGDTAGSQVPGVRSAGLFEIQPPGAWGFTVPAFKCRFEIPTSVQKNSRNCLWSKLRCLQELRSLKAAQEPSLCFFFLFEACF